MKRTWKLLTVPLVSLVFVNACATKGALRNVEQRVANQEAALEQERNERMSADQRLAADLAQLRTDLETMREDYDARIAAVENGLQFVLPVHFAFDDATVRPQDYEALDRFVDVVSKHYTGAVVTVEGFADPAGPRAYNEQLSERRADSVREYLLQRGIAADVRSVGYGEDRLVIDGAEKDDAGAEMNRRVVFVVETPARGDAVTLLVPQS
ncbi:MAG TPA: OmpA family protein [Longimicrobiales bacterium]|nr:OmpA family protein [Longimicrobiales bacterium]